MAALGRPEGTGYAHFVATRPSFTERRVTRRQGGSPQRQADREVPALRVRVFAAADDKTDVRMCPTS